MKAIPIQMEDVDDDITEINSTKTETWEVVCERFDNDVHRVRDVRGHAPFTALYTCYDEDNEPFYYLVEENRQLQRIRRKVFLNKLGRSESSNG